MTRHSTYAFFMTLCGCFCSSTAASTELVRIPLSGVRTDPLIDFTPPDNTADRAVATSDGLRIVQSADSKKRKHYHEVGVKFLVHGSGDFSTALDWKANLISEPSQGWGQGVTFSVSFDNAEQTKIQMALIGQPGQGLKLRVSKRYRSGKEDMLFDEPFDFKSGEFRITRQENVAIASVRRTNAPIVEIVRTDIANDGIRSIDVWCTRQSVGNTRADYLLRSLEVSADEFFAFQKPATSEWPLWQKMLLVQSCFLAALLVWITFKRIHAA
ncbi:hypothetical protein [Rhodopirellula europaea]|uniref:hypothetical protein n=1 Tax=Rhodopirellula europaea TaxID=1263866 RepID=UPI003D26DDF2